MPLFFMNALGFLKGLPWQVWVAAAILATNPISYCKGESDGKQVIIERLEKAEAEAKIKAIQSAAAADDNQAEATAEFEAEQETLQKAIDDAKAADSNPLDAIFAGGV